MVINEKEVNLLYTVGAKCLIDASLIEHGAGDVPKLITMRGSTYVTALFAAVMSQAYCDVNGGEAITLTEILNMPMDVKLWEELDALVAAALNIGQKVTVEAVPEKKAKRTK